MRSRLLSLCLTLSLALPMTAQGMQQVQSFPDVPSDHDNSRAIMILQQAGLFTGYPDGTFGPSFSINRAELLKILVMSLGSDSYAHATPDNCFPDVHKDDWFSTYVCFAAAQKWVSGYPDGMFRPERVVNLAEALKMIVTIRQLDLNPRRFPAQGYARDAWYTPYIDTLMWNDAVSLESITGAEKIFPREGIDAPLTRMRAAELLYREMLFEGRVMYRFDQNVCKMSDVQTVSLHTYDTKITSDNTAIIDFDILGKTRDGQQCVIASHANPYAGVSRYWNSRTMFLVTKEEPDTVLDEVSAGSTIYLRSGHETAGLGNQLWAYDTATNMMSMVPFTK